MLNLANNRVVANNRLVKSKWLCVLKTLPTDTTFFRESLRSNQINRLHRLDVACINELAKCLSYQSRPLRYFWRTSSHGWYQFPNMCCRRSWSIIRHAKMAVERAYREPYQIGRQTIRKVPVTVIAQSKVISLVGSTATICSTVSVDITGRDIGITPVSVSFIHFLINKRHEFN